MASLMRASVYLAARREPNVTKPYILAQRDDVIKNRVGQFLPDRRVLAAVASAAPQQQGRRLFDQRDLLDPATTEKPIVQIKRLINQQNGDGSYTYGFEADDGSFKIETRDKLGNVKGKYGYYDVNNELKVVDYVAGNGTGFDAKADFLPKSQEPLPPPRGEGQPPQARPAPRPAQQQLPQRFQQEEQEPQQFRPQQSGAPPSRPSAPRGISTFTDPEGIFQFSFPSPGQPAGPSPAAPFGQFQEESFLRKWNNCYSLGFQGKFHSIMKPGSCANVSCFVRPAPRPAQQQLPQRFQQEEQEPQQFRPQQSGAPPSRPSAPRGISTFTDPEGIFQFSFPSPGQPAGPSPAGQIGAGGQYIPSIELEGFSDDEDKDGFVDPVPNGLPARASRRQPQHQGQQHHQQQQQQQPSRPVSQPQFASVDFHQERPAPQQQQQAQQFASSPQFPTSPSQAGPERPRFIPGREDERQRFEQQVPQRFAPQPQPPRFAAPPPQFAPPQFAVSRQIGAGGQYIPSIELEGFSDDEDKDGFVDPHGLPEGRARRSAVGVVVPVVVVVVVVVVVGSAGHSVGVKRSQHFHQERPAPQQQQQAQQFASSPQFPTSPSQAGPERPRFIPGREDERQRFEQQVPQRFAPQPQPPRFAAPPPQFAPPQFAQSPQQGVPRFQSEFGSPARFLPGPPQQQQQESIPVFNGVTDSPRAFVNPLSLQQPGRRPF
ncbi:unnamed protein product [Notodromas monacha]|uniref:Uncharacterized protein n=1 Tax=Notodromas monacha TaxID=399045 RepID=A0A7R9GGW1_9CRUS|nr:unnamed protein product [Notodromas monacha]CAG0922263.1 unnamed protein product [Notodromas monacha]